MSADDDAETASHLVRRHVETAVSALRVDITNAVEIAKNKVKWIATQQDSITDMYKTIICEAIDAVPPDALVSGSVSDAVDYLLTIPVIYPRVTEQSYPSEQYVWYNQVDLTIPLRFILTGDEWDVAGRQWARADGTVGVDDVWGQVDLSDDEYADGSSNESSDDAYEYVSTFHPVAIKRGELFSWMKDANLTLHAKGYRGKVAGHSRVWTSLEWEFYTGVDGETHGADVPDNMDEDDTPWEKINLLSRTRKLDPRNTGAHESAIVDALERLNHRPEIRAQLAYINLQYTNDLRYRESASLSVDAATRSMTQSSTRAQALIPWMHPRKSA